MQQQSRDAAGPRRQREAARGGEVTGARVPKFPDDSGQRPAFQRLLHRPQGLLALRRVDEDEPRRVEAEGGEAGAVERAALGGGEILGDPHQRPPPQRGSGGKTQRQRQREAGRGGAVGRAGGHDLMQRPACEAAAQHRVKLRGVRAQRHAPARPRAQSRPARLDAGDGGAQTGLIGDVSRPAALRHRMQSIPVKFYICSY